MDEIEHRQLMNLSDTSRVATVDTSELATESASASALHPVPALSDLLELGLESLLQHFRRK
jgi:hypothetical protein